MGSLISSRPSPAIIVAVVALIAALAGTAVAGPSAGTSKLTKKKVRSIADQEIQKLASGLSVASANTANSANTAAKLANVTVQREDFQVTDGTNNGTTVSCPAGQQAISGGIRSNAVDGFVTTSRPVTNVDDDLTDGQSFDGWRGFVTNQAGGSGTITANVFVVCAS